jgi:hypothetical protein
LQEINFIKEISAKPLFSQEKTNLATSQENDGFIPNNSRTQGGGEFA